MSKFLEITNKQQQRIMLNLERVQSISELFDANNQAVGTFFDFGHDFYFASNEDYISIRQRMGANDLAFIIYENAKKL